MTTSRLLLWILAALLLQVSLGVAVALWRRRTAPADARQPDEAPVPTLTPTTAAWPGTRAFRVAARQFEDASNSQCSFLLEPADGRPLPEFKPGQFLTFMLAVPDAALPGGVRPVTRCYSLSDGPTPTSYRVTIKRVPPPPDRPSLPPGVASNHFHDRVHPGDVLEVKAPGGHFHIDPDPSAPVALVAGGIGITPMMSMLRWCLSTQPGRPVHLFYGLRNGGEHAFKADLEALAAANPAFRLHVVYSRPDPDDRQPDDYQHLGRIDLALLQRSLPHGRHQFYICGPGPMMETLVPALAAWGVPDADIHFEAFGPASVRNAAPAAAGTSATPETVPSVPLDVAFTRSGRTLAWDGQDASLLDFAERNGVALESGCRSGGCGTCETRMVSGTVRYDSPPDHDVKRGHCLPCVARPTSALVLEA